MKKAVLTESEISTKGESVVSGIFHKSDVS
jgi:hypothetical protein